MKDTNLRGGDKETTSTTCCYLSGEKFPNTRRKISGWKKFQANGKIRQHKAFGKLV